MFLLIGISPKIKQAGSFQGDCPACGSRRDLHVVKRYSALSLFFLPLIPLGGSYMATCPACASVMSLPDHKGRALERNGHIEVSPSEMEILKNNLNPVCGRCGARVNQGQNFCYNCGERLS